MKIHALRPCRGAIPRLRPPPARGGVYLDGAQNLDDRFWSARASAPWRYDLFQLLRRIDAQAGGRYSLGRAPLPRYEPLRLGQTPELAFTAANIAAITPYADTGLRQVDIVGFGLFGPNGPLPLHMTEYAFQRAQQDNDPSLTAFANIFHHRLIMLFYRAWADAQQCVSFDRPDNRRFDDYAACLIGIGRPAQRQGGLSALARYYMAGHLTRHPRNSEGLGAIIRHFFSVPARVRENVFQWLRLPRGGRLCLHAAGAATRLGIASCLGVAAPDRQYRFAIDIGPLSRRQYAQFLPARRRRPGKLAQLREWVIHYVGMEYAWEARLILHRDHYRGCALGDGQPLGRNCWLGHNVRQRHRGDWVYAGDDIAGAAGN
ncbi:type VI secretion system baseplate subunit TssG [Sodalis sp. RH21]|uniref:type VI secretion system baseplate subunit TssG n=1 Tax=unclassified Sodalis (in: enterobacteria) TaxID=2636512 RepID=UPI0039B4529B